MELQHQSDASARVNAPTSDSRTATVFRAVAVVVLLLVQAAIAWFFAELWWWHVSNIFEAPTLFPVISRALTAALFLGIVVTEVLALVRRRTHPVLVAVLATAALIFMVLLEGSGVF